MASSCSESNKLRNVTQTLAMVMMMNVRMRNIITIKMMMMNVVMRNMMMVMVMMVNMTISNLAGLILL